MTYPQLLLDIQAYLENDEIEFTVQLGTFVRLAELRLARDLTVQAMNSVATGTLAPGATRVPRPADLVLPRYLQITLENGQAKILPLKKVEWLVEFWPDERVTGVPKYYAIEDADTYRIAPPATGATQYALAYKRRFPPLSELSPTNWLTQNAYDALLFAAVAEAAAFVQDDRQGGLISTYEGKYGAALAALNGVDTRADRDDYRVPAVPVENR